MPISLCVFPFFSERCANTQVGGSGLQSVEDRKWTGGVDLSVKGVHRILFPIFPTPSSPQSYTSKIAGVSPRKNIGSHEAYTRLNKPYLHKVK